MSRHDPLPALRADGRYVVSDKRLIGLRHDGFSHTWLVAAAESDDLADFIAQACNDRSAILENAERCVPRDGEPSFVLLGRDPHAPALVERWASDREVVEPDSSKPEAARQIASEMRAYRGIEPASSFGWSAGLAFDKLSVGPLPTCDAAIEAGRREHGASATIYVVEAEPAKPILAPFGSGEVAKVLGWIENDNAAPFGPDAVLPPLGAHHESALADKLNAAVAAWAAENGITIISAKLGTARQFLAAVPHEVDSITLRPVANPGEFAPAVVYPTLPLENIAFDKDHESALAAILADEVDRYPTATECEPLAVRRARLNLGLRVTTTPTHAGPHTSSPIPTLDDRENTSC